MLLRSVESDYRWFCCLEFCSGYKYGGWAGGRWLLHEISTPINCIPTLLHVLQHADLMSIYICGNKGCLQLTTTRWDNLWKLSEKSRENNEFCTKGWNLKKFPFPFYPWSFQADLSLIKHGQNSKVRKVLKFSGSQLFKGVLTFDFWPCFTRSQIENTPTHHVS